MYEIVFMDGMRMTMDEREFYLLAGTDVIDFAEPDDQDAADDESSFYTRMAERPYLINADMIRYIRRIYEEAET